ncbi:serine-threonine rich, putative [Entamoeba histolytica HM-1:IMSS-B]|uniref:Serine-threonine rich protein n=6 Tax=Entamoeba histolytica TaxID=5759 RepID=C4M3E4_ENTH1|nr:serine-threonine rich protein [Entamoeba histolytica HM-1:IMSS]EMD48034.1 serine/threonine -rich protein, putative [Entamoeba histolytica KU27]EMH73329.1 serine-threonine rich, putative [Entamoeba histolytica HM-1:IMSS-B]EMS15644.1 serine-threonine rich protein [Entamoeba histolytica HM-3:IMSS]ENY65695.1 serine-threonine rich protein, putative [Entamoeba histolytica HM-1:IMSS-A]GAT95832.1 serine-threonine rich protein [Entamoeba histolytica]|eukprot:XP_654889.1 serine-threonine rich protein [Entamoeba histolytica HM-1:IMSS]
MKRQDLSTTNYFSDFVQNIAGYFCPNSKPTQGIHRMATLPLSSSLSQGISSIPKQETSLLFGIAFDRRLEKLKEQYAEQPVAQTQNSDSTLKRQDAGNLLREKPEEQFERPKEVTKRKVEEAIPKTEDKTTKKVVERKLDTDSARIRQTIAKLREINFEDIVQCLNDRKERLMNKDSVKGFSHLNSNTNDEKVLKASISSLLLSSSSEEEELVPLGKKDKKEKQEEQNEERKKFKKSSLKRTVKVSSPKKKVVDLNNSLRSVNDKSQGLLSFDIKDSNKSVNEQPLHLDSSTKNSSLSFTLPLDSSLSQKKTDQTNQLSLDFKTDKPFDTKEESKSPSFDIKPSSSFSLFGGDIINDTKKSDTQPTIGTTLSTEEKKIETNFSGLTEKPLSSPFSLNGFSFGKSTEKQQDTFTGNALLTDKPKSIESNTEKQTTSIDKTPSTTTEQPSTNMFSNIGFSFSISDDKQNSNTNAVINENNDKQKTTQNNSFETTSSTTDKSGSNVFSIKELSFGTSNEKSTTNLSTQPTTTNTDKLTNNTFSLGEFSFGLSNEKPKSNSTQDSSTEKLKESNTNVETPLANPFSLNGFSFGTSTDKQKDTLISNPSLTDQSKTITSTTPGSSSDKPINTSNDQSKPTTVNSDNNKTDNFTTAPTPTLEQSKTNTLTTKPSSEQSKTNSFANTGFSFNTSNDKTSVDPFAAFTSSTTTTNQLGNSSFGFGVINDNKLQDKTVTNNNSIGSTDNSAKDSNTTVVQTSKLFSGQEQSSGLNVPNSPGLESQKQTTTSGFVFGNFGSSNVNPSNEKNTTSFGQSNSSLAGFSNTQTTPSSTAQGPLTNLTLGTNQTNNTNLGFSNFFNSNKPTEGMNGQLQNTSQTNNTNPFGNTNFGNQTINFSGGQQNQIGFGQIGGSNLSVQGNTSNGNPFSSFSNSLSQFGNTINSSNSAFNVDDVSGSKSFSKKR